MRRWITGLLTKNLALKMISIGLAVLIFILVHKEKHTLVQGSLQVSYLMPEDKVLASEHPTVLTLGVTGPATRVRRFTFSELPPVTIDLEEYQEGYFRFREEMFDLPNGLKVAFVHPQGFQVRFEPLLSKDVSVQLALRGEVAPGMRIARTLAMPPMVRISGPRRLVNAISEVSTEPLPIDRAKQTIVREVLLAPLPRGVSTEATRAVTATVEIAPIGRTVSLSRVPVQLAGPGGSVVTPKTVKVLLDVPLAAVDKMKTAKLVATVRARSEELPVQVKPQLRGLPPGVSVLEIAPAQVNVR